MLASQAQPEAQPVQLTDFHVARFAEPHAWNEQEVRRLIPAVQQPSSLLAVEPTAEGSLRLWGMLFSDHAWDQVPSAPRRAVAAPPRALLVQVSGPGGLVFYYGDQRLLTLQRGRIEGHGFLQFSRAWGEGRFSENQQLAGPAAAALTWTTVQEECVVQFVLHMQRRTLLCSRAEGHSVVLVPTHRVAEVTAPGGVLRPKYGLTPGTAGPRFPALVAALVQRLLALGELSWARYQQA